MDKSGVQLAIDNPEVMQDIFSLWTLDRDAMTKSGHLVVNGVLGNALIQSRISPTDDGSDPQWYMRAFLLDGTYPPPKINEKSIPLDQDPTKKFTDFLEKTGANYPLVKIDHHVTLDDITIYLKSTN